MRQLGQVQATKQGQTLHSAGGLTAVFPTASESPHRLVSQWMT